MSEKKENQGEDLSADLSTEVPTLFDIGTQVEALASAKAEVHERRRTCRAVAFLRRRMAQEPLGYDHERRFEQHYPRIYGALRAIELPFQLVDTVETGVKHRYEKDELFPNGLNRLFFGDCLHVMRMLPSECIDLIYIDQPFFSGRNYNIIFGDKNEVRSFTDIWEGGMTATLSLHEFWYGNR